MKVKGKDKVCFKDVKQGHVFILDGRVYIRTVPTNKYNAANLETGHIREIGPDLAVILKPNATVHLD